MKLQAKILLILLMTGAVFAGPPEPPGMPESPPEPKVEIRMDSTEKVLERIEKKMKKYNTNLVDLDSLLKNLDNNVNIKNLTIGGDSILILLNNDSTLIFRDLKDLPPEVGNKDVFRIGKDVTVDEGEVIDGDIVVVRGDVRVDGTVNGGVTVFSGNIYVSSTGYIKNGAIALSGNVKQEPGARVGTVHVGIRESRDLGTSESSIYRIMGIVFLIIFIFWWILSATCSSLFGPNINKVAESVIHFPIKSYFKGYLTFVLAFAAFLVLIITIIGIPLAFVGLPLVILAGMIMSSTAVSNVIGQKITNSEKYSFRSYLYGSLILGGAPAILFLIQAVTGSFVAMVFNWIFIGIFILVILPIGLGGVLSTRFGTHRDKNLGTPAQTASPA